MMLETTFKEIVICQTYLQLNSYLTRIVHNWQAWDRRLGEIWSYKDWNLSGILRVGAMWDYMWVLYRLGIE